MRREDSEILARVGRGTPLGDTMRRYWHPVATSAELPHPDCDPLRTKVLGERLVAFRDSDGKVGVMDELCMHRGASLALGRVEDGGIRCLYHGWKFSVDGTILETPNLSEPRIRERLKAPSYPARESGGLVWAYLGPAELEPPFRHFAFADAEEENRVVLRINVNANFLPLWEGGADTAHVTLLHSNVARPSWALKEGMDGPAVTDLLNPAFDDTAPTLEIEDTSFGFHYVGIRQIPDTARPERNIRLVPIFMPNGRIIPFTDFFTTIFEVPRDDESTSTYLIDASFSRLPHDRPGRLKRSGLADAHFYQDNNFVASWDDGFFQDREAMKQRKNWTGFSGITQEDFVIATSMGVVPDRMDSEHLVPSDMAIMRLRRRLLDSVELNQAGGAPLGLMHEDMTSMLARDVNLDAGRPWQEIVPQESPLYARSEGGR
jgi:phthalate 4,5-dioxygenase oxygenase subunit